MKNVTILTKLRRLTKSLAVSFVFLLIGLTNSSFTANTSTNNEDLKKSGRDSTLNDKNSFPGLFSSTNAAENTLAVVLNPKAISFVQKFVSENSDRLNRMKVWGKPYFDVFDFILLKQGLPIELKYLSVVESSLNVNALSPVGALGPWQIMPAEARRLGLVVNGSRDDRRNYTKSTYAAALFLKELYVEFKDWLLVVAAYNCGPGRLRQAIRKSGSKDFWLLQSYLPRETSAHVKKFIGTHYVFEGSGGLTTMTAAEINDRSLRAEINKVNLAGNEEFTETTSTTQINGKYNAAVIAKSIGMDLELFTKLNPKFDKLLSGGTPQTLTLPAGKMAEFESKRQLILKESVKMWLN